MTERKVGRPPMAPEERMVHQSVHLKVPAPLFDALCVTALKHGVSVHRVVLAKLFRIYGMQNPKNSSNLC